MSNVAESRVESLIPDTGLRVGDKAQGPLASRVSGLRAQTPHQGSWSCYFLPVDVPQFPWAENGHADSAFLLEVLEN